MNSWTFVGQNTVPHFWVLNLFYSSWVNILSLSTSFHLSSLFILTSMRSYIYIFTLFRTDDPCFDLKNTTKWIHEVHESKLLFHILPKTTHKCYFHALLKTQHNAYRLKHVNTFTPTPTMFILMLLYIYHNAALFEENVQRHLTKLEINSPLWLYNTSMLIGILQAFFFKYHEPY